MSLRPNEGNAATPIILAITHKKDSEKLLKLIG